MFQDRDGLKSLKESYEQELENVISAALRIRIGQLEELVQEYEKIINEDPSAKRSCRECEMRIKLISELKNE
jgi:flagellar basal body rod protein FlgF